MTDARPRARWASAGSSVLAAGLAVGLALAGLLLSLWPALGLSLLGASTILVVLGVAAARAARREHASRGERGWGVLAAYVVHALAALVVGVSWLGGGVLGALVTFGPPLPPARHASSSSYESRAPELLAVAGIVGAAYVLHVVSRSDAPDAPGANADASASQADASASQADASASQADASASQADASASRDPRGSSDADAFPLGAALLGALAVVGAAEYGWEHREDVAWVAGVLGLVAVAAVLDDGASTPPAPAAP
ncbi:MAG: hypothetical protein K1X94_26465 [Sandaracinaceae bacterium]|nr:hypothetical protein [Sandaracinaceae bacterium]